MAVIKIVTENSDYIRLFYLFFIYFIFIFITDHVAYASTNKTKVV